MEDWERIQFIMNEEGLNKNSFSKAIGITNNVTITRIINERRSPSKDTCKKIVAAFPKYNLEWLLTGEGNIINEKNNTPTKNMETSEPFKTYLLPMSAMGGSLTGFTSSAMLKDCEAIISPIENVDFAISVYGDSMAPEYTSGSRVLIKKINPNIFIDWGKTYVLDTPNGVIIKEIHECKDKPGYIRCHSINPDPKFSDFDVPLNEVYGIYRVLMCLSAK